MTVETIFVCALAASLAEPPPKFDARRDGVAYGRVECVAYASKTTGAERKCNVILPAGYDGRRKFPVLYLLHGIGGDHNEWLCGAPLAIAGNAVAAGATPCVIVIPNARAMKNDAVPSNPFSPEAVAAFDNFINDFFTDLKPFVESRYAVKTGSANTAMAGLSMGGRESLMIGFKRPDAFSAIGAFSPAPGVPLDIFRKPAGAASPMLMMCCGTEDGLVGKAAAEYHATLLRNGVAHTWYTMPGGHDFSVWKNGLWNFAMRIFK